MAKAKGSPKTGGRQKGSRNKRTTEIEASGKLPLDFLLEIMRDETKDWGMRLDAAKAAAPYVHARRAPEDKGGNTVPTIIYTHPPLEEE